MYTCLLSKPKINHSLFNFKLTLYTLKYLEYLSHYNKLQWARLCVYESNLFVVSTLWVLDLHLKLFDVYER